MSPTAVQAAAEAWSLSLAGASAQQPCLQALSAGPQQPLAALAPHWLVARKQLSLQLLQALLQPQLLLGLLSPLHVAVSLCCTWVLPHAELLPLVGWHQPDESDEPAGARLPCGRALAGVSRPLPPTPAASA